MVKISSIVLLYNSKLADSDTLKSLLSVELATDIHLLVNIWNNGPNKLDEKDVNNYLEQAKSKNIFVKVYEDCRNIALSKVYNFFIEKNNYDFIAIFDQDSILPEDYFQSIKNNLQIDLLIPQIYSREHRLVYPIDIETHEVIQEKGFLDIERLASIGSGIALSVNLVNVFKDIHTKVFNENFAFYGIDTSFFYDLRKLAKDDHNITGICIDKMQHSLSMHEQELLEIKTHRQLEHLFDDILTRLHYRNKTKWSVFWKVIVRKYRKGKIKGIKVFFMLTYTVITGHHPRSRFAIKAKSVYSN